MFLIKICIVLITIQLVLSQKFLFDSATIILRGNKKKLVRSYKQVTTIDQHHFGAAVDMKIITTKMNLYEGAVKSLPYLKILRAKKCGIEILEAKAFMNLRSLNEVHLQDNKLSVISNGVFNYLPIRKLWLQRNKIVTIQSSAFDNMPELKVIKLGRNRLSKWDSRWFANTPKLTELFFMRNQIQEIPGKAFVNLKTSHKIGGDELVDTRILFNSNRISSIHPEAFQGIDSLNELDLRKNALEEIDWKVFSHMTELNILNLKMNSLKKIDADAFENVETILDLNLSKNLFECVPYEIISKSKKVDLSSNDHLQCECFHNLMEKLEEDKVDNKVVARDLLCAFE